MVLLTQIRNAAKRIPMIKFRAGNKNSHNIASTSASTQEVTPAKQSVSCVINKCHDPDRDKNCFNKIIEFNGRFLCNQFFPSLFL